MCAGYLHDLHVANPPYPYIWYLSIPISALPRIPAMYLIPSTLWLDDIKQQSRRFYEESTPVDERFLRGSPRTRVMPPAHSAVLMKRRSDPDGCRPAPPSLI
jgi:hypothetical protein